MMAVTTTNIPNEHITIINNPAMATIPQGPATRALEQCYPSLKRRRTESPTDVFNFSDAFNNLSPQHEAFPVIAWDFDDADESDKGAGPRAVEKSPHRQVCCEPPLKKPRGMPRSKSYRSGLSLLGDYTS